MRAPQGLFTETIIIYIWDMANSYKDRWEIGMAAGFLDGLGYRMKRDGCLRVELVNDNVGAARVVEVVNTVTRHAAADLAPVLDDVDELEDDGDGNLPLC